MPQAMLDFCLTCGNKYNPAARQVLKSLCNMFLPTGRGKALCGLLRLTEQGAHLGCVVQALWNQAAILSQP